MMTQLQLHTVDERRQQDLVHLLAAALDSPELTPPEKDVVKILGFHRGAANAISSRKIVELLGQQFTVHTRRWICLVIETLVLLHHLPIGASRGAGRTGAGRQPAGYFLIETQADLDIATGPRRKEMYAIARYLRALTSKEEVARLFGQAQLQLDSESAASGESR